MTNVIIRTFIFKKYPFCLNIYKHGPPKQNNSEHLGFVGTNLLENPTPHVTLTRRDGTRYDTVPVSPGGRLNVYLYPNPRVNTGVM